MWALSDASPSSSSSSSDSGRLSARTKAVPPQQASALTIWVTHVGLWLSQAFRTIATKMFLRPRFSCHLQSGFEIGLCAFWLCWNLRRHPDETMTLLNSSQLPQFIRSPIMAVRLTQRKSSLAVQRPDVPRRCAIIFDHFCCFTITGAKGARDQWTAARTRGSGDQGSKHCLLIHFFDRYGILACNLLNLLIQCP